jgi:hypothetical protein
MKRSERRWPEKKRPGFSLLSYGDQSDVRFAPESGHSISK